MKLYDVPRGSRLKIKTERCPEGEFFTFHHIDGMYSLNTAESDEKYLHLSSATPMKKEQDYYVISH